MARHARPPRSRLQALAIDRMEPWSAVTVPSGAIATSSSLLMRFIAYRRMVLKPFF
jgi:hypothetical protein